MKLFEARRNRALPGTVGIWHGPHKVAHVHYERQRTPVVNAREGLVWVCKTADEWDQWDAARREAVAMLEGKT